jgi:hypothetical protein
LLLHTCSTHISLHHLHNVLQLTGNSCVYDSMCCLLYHIPPSGNPISTATAPYLCLFCALLFSPMYVGAVAATTSPTIHATVHQRSGALARSLQRRVWCVWGYWLPSLQSPPPPPCPGSATRRLDGCLLPLFSCTALDVLLLPRGHRISKKTPRSHVPIWLHEKVGTCVVCLPKSALFVSSRLVSRISALSGRSACPLSHSP